MSTPQATTSNRKKAQKKGEDELSTSKLFHIPVHLIEVEDGFNNRLDYGSEKFEELRDNIKENGVKEPIRVIPHPTSKGRYILREGHRRMRAVELLLKAGEAIKKVPAIIASKETPEDSLLRMVSSNNGKPFENIELGLTFEKLVNFGWSVKDISKKTGYKENKVYFCLSLTKLPKKYHKMMADGSIQDSLVVNVFRHYKDDPEKAEKELDKSIKNATKEHEQKVKTTIKEAEAKGAKIKKSEIKKTKITAKHLSPKSAVANPLQKIEEAIITAEKKPDVYDQKKVLLLNTIYQCVTHKGTANEILEILKLKK